MVVYNGLSEAFLHGRDEDSGSSAWLSFTVGWVR